MSTPAFTPRPEVMDLKPYNSGLTLEDVAARCGGGPIAKLASNENAHPPSDAVTAAMSDAIARAFLYPDPQAQRLAKEICARSGVPAHRIIFGDGSEDLLNILARAILRPQDQVITLYPSFPLHEDYALMMGATVTRIGLTPERRIDVEGLLDAAARPARLILIANPMNPAGLWLTGDDIGALLQAQHPDTLLCIDEAYVEYAQGGDYKPADEWLSAHEKPLLLLRTFSKAHGLAGLRVGYGLSNCDGVVQAMNLVRTPFNVNAVAQAAALASLRHPEAMDKAVTATIAERGRMADELTRRGYEVLPSKGNFLFFDCGRPAVEAADALIDHGAIVKPWKQAGYETFIRVSVGLPSENDQFLAALAVI